MSGLQTYEELQANLAEYRAQLQQVEQLLLMGGDEELPGQDLQDMYQSLAEVIALTEELVKEAQQHQQPAAAGGAQPSSSAAGAHEQIVTPPELNLPGNLPSSVAEQIRKAQVKAALLGQAPAVWAVGAPCQATWSADGKYYNAVVDSISESGNFLVVFEGYEDKEEVALTNIRPRPEEGEGYRGVAAPKRKRVEDAPVLEEIPKWLEIKEGDDEKTRLRKKKLLKSFKSKRRFQNMDLVQKQKQDSWQSFLKGKGTKKKTGFLTGTKKQSMFSVPEGVNSKVGVIGSGKGMTEYKGRTRHEFEQADDDQ